VNAQCQSQFQDHLQVLVRPETIDRTAVRAAQAGEQRLVVSKADGLDLVRGNSHLQVRGCEADMITRQMPREGVAVPEQKDQAGCDEAGGLRASTQHQTCDQVAAQGEGWPELRAQREDGIRRADPGSSVPGNLARRTAATENVAASPR
jgi:hypothetical protein